MSRALAQLAVGVAAVAGVYLVTRKKKKRVVKPPLTPPVLLVGDSLAVGLAQPLGELMAQRKLTFASEGRSGSTAAQWLSKGWLAAALKQHHPKQVLISLGTNDSVTKAGADTFPAFMKDVLAKVRAAGAVPIVLAPPKMSWRVPTVVGAAVINAPAIPRQPDGVHPYGAGYSIWAQHIIRWFS